VSILRFANVLGPDVRTSHIGLFSLPAVPMIFGFDPRYQFVHEDDVVHALEHAVKSKLPGVYNVAGDGVLALSEVAGLLGKPYAPVLPFWGTGMAASALRRIGVNIPPEALNQLRFGRGVDNRRFKATGFVYGYTSREAVLKLGEHLRLHPLVRGGQEPYRYEREVEDFLRWSPHVKNSRDRPPGYPQQGRGAVAAEQEERVLAAERAAEHAIERAQQAEQAVERVAEEAERAAAEAAAAEAERRAAAEAGEHARRQPARSPVEHYDDLAAEEVIALLASLERDDLQTLRDYERRHANRARVLSAIESVLARRETPV
jgi:UDP-glucose 4-epimerase